MRPGRPGRRARLGAIAVTTLVALISLVSGCTASGSPGSSDPSRSATSSDSPTATATGPVTLSVAVYGDPAVVRGYERMARAYHARHPSVTVRVTSSPSDVLARLHLREEFADGSAPDLFLADSDSLPELVAGNRVQPVDGLLEERGIQFGDAYERLGLEAFAGNSALQCMPEDVSPYVVYYNPQLVDPATFVVEPNASPSPSPTTTPTEVTSWTWDQFVSAAAQASRPGVRGVSLAPSLRTLAPLLRSAGSDIVDDPGRPTTLTLADGSARDALQQVLDVAQDRSLTYGPAQLRHKGTLSRFEDGELAMMIGTRALVPELRRHADLRFDVFPLPSFERQSTIADVTGLCINRVSRHIDAAADFLAFASGRRGSALVSRSGGIVPANIAVLRTEAFVQAGLLPRHPEVFTRTIRRADTMPNPAAWPQVVDRTQPLLDRLFRDRRVDLDRLLPRIDRTSARLLAAPSPSASPSDG